MAVLAHPILEKLITTLIQAKETVEETSRDYYFETYVTDDEDNRKHNTKNANNRKDLEEGHPTHEKKQARLDRRCTTGRHHGRRRGTSRRRGGAIVSTGCTAGVRQITDRKNGGYHIHIHHNCLDARKEASDLGWVGTSATCASRVFTPISCGFNKLEHLIISILVEDEVTGIVRSLRRRCAQERPATCMALRRIDHTFVRMQFRIHEGIQVGQVDVKALVDAEVVNDESLDADFIPITEMGGKRSGGNESGASGQEEANGVSELHGDS
jgi:hypothetical protein